MCRGSYINPSNSNLTLHNESLRIILENISIFEFLKSKKYSTGSLNCPELYRDFARNSQNDKIADEEQFLVLCDEFTKYGKLFDEYKNLFLKEKYYIDDKTITGEYFRSLLQLKNEYLMEAKICNLAEYPTSKKQCVNLLKDEIDIQIEENGFYVALPLYATERYFGIIRILYPTKQTFILEHGNEYKLTEEYQERLGYFSQLISLHIETNYYLAGYKKLSSVNETITEISLLKLSKACELLSEVVNCNGAMIRLFKESTLQPEIRGYTDTLAGYVRFLKSFKDPQYPEVNQFSQAVISLFTEDGNIMAVSFSTELEAEKKVNIFSIDNDNNIIQSQRIMEIGDLKSEKYRGKLDELNIKQITIVPIQNINNSYMVLTNTINRKFITADVEMLILAVKGMGLEIKHIQDSEKITKQQQEIAQTESMRTVIHQVAAPLHGMRSHISNMLKGDIEVNARKEKLKQMFFMIKHSIRQLTRFQKTLNFDVKPVKEILGLRKFLIERCIEFQSLAKSKGIGIFTYSSEEKFKSLESIETDRELLEEVMNNLIDNAIKYSFNASSLRANGINYDESNPKSDGNILIYHYTKLDKTFIRVTSWGASISEEEKLKIFEKDYRGENANQFSTMGSGIGLFLVKRIIEALKAEISVSSRGNKTEFIIAIRN